jgi:8-oxo-dGTP pyrophosphatase MutT (NUDIX family)
MINGSFVIVEYNGKYLWMDRSDNGLGDIPGGGFNCDETDDLGVGRRELIEETRIKLPRESFYLCAKLGQRLKEEIAKKHNVHNGYAFLYRANLYEEPIIKLSKEHTKYYFLSYEEIISSYKKLSSGPLWLFFTYLAFKETYTLQTGKLYDRRIWQGKEYI